MAYEQIKKSLNTAYEWLLRLEVSRENVKRLALAEQALEEAFAQLTKLEKEQAPPEPKSEVKPDGES